MTENNKATKEIRRSITSKTSYRETKDTSYQ